MSVVRRGFRLGACPPGEPPCARFWGRGGWEASPTRPLPNPARASTAAEGEERKRVFPISSRRNNNKTPRRRPALGRHASTSGGVGDGRHPPLALFRTRRERAPQPKARSASECSPSHRDATTTKPRAAVRRWDATRPPLGAWGMGGIPHSPSSEPGASEHRSRRRGAQASVPHLIATQQQQNPAPPSGVGTPRVHLWGRGGWEASPTRPLPNPARASTAAEGE